MQRTSPKWPKKTSENANLNDEVMLLNGTMASERLVKETMVRLLQLKDPFKVPGGILDPCSLEFFVELCRDPAYELLPFTKQMLINYHLLDAEGNLPEAIKNIVLSGTQGSGDQIELFNPINYGEALENSPHVREPGKTSTQTPNASLFKVADREEKASELYACVENADYDKAYELVKKHPQIMFYKTSHEQEKLSSLQLALKSYDTYMWKMFNEHIKDDPILVARFRKQANAIDSFVDLTPLFAAYEYYINIIQEWRKASAQEKPMFRGPGVAAAETIAKLQRQFLPAHMLREFCRKGNNWGAGATFNDIEPPKEPLVSNDHQASFVYVVRFINVLPHEPNKGLGHDYGIARDNNKCFSYSCNGNAPDDRISQNNLDGLKRLFDQRKNEFYQFFPEIKPAAEFTNLSESSMCRLT